MKIKLGTLRRLLIKELGGASVASSHWPGQPMRNATSPDINTREQIGAISAKAIDTVNDEEGLPNHLLEPEVDLEDCYGPVPPISEPVRLNADPFTHDYAPQPFSGGGKIKR